MKQMVVNDLLSEVIIILPNISQGSPNTGIEDINIGLVNRITITIIYVSFNRVADS